MNRCIGFNKNNNKCRAIVKNSTLFCCKSHEPLNVELLKNGCFICMDEITDKKEFLLFKCNHIVHKPCYMEWLNDYSTYENPICMICRQDTFQKIKKEKILKKKILYNNFYKIINISNILLQNNQINYSSGITGSFNF